MGLEQLEIDIELQEKQRLLYEATYKYRETLFGGARGGGKSAGIRRVHLIRRLRHPGSKGLIARKTYPEIFKNHIVKILEEFPGLREFYKSGEKAIVLPNRSRLEFGHYEKLADIDKKAQGQEWDDQTIDEVGNWTEDEYQRLASCNRNTGADINTSAFHTCNPGGIGHAHLKKKFIDRDVPNPERYHFIQSLLEDNPALLEKDPDYALTLELETNPVLRAAFRFGVWDLPTGQFFDRLRKDLHLVEPFNIPGHWKRFGAYDFGFGHPASWGWYAVGEDQTVYKYRELVVARKDVPEQAELVLKYPESSKLIWHAGHDVFSRKIALGDSTPTIAQEFARAKIILQRANNARVLGAARLRMYLNWREVEDEKQKGKTKIVGPKLKFFKTCPITFACLGRMAHDPDNIEDVLKVDSTVGDTNTGDDAYDETRYGIMTRPPVTLPLQTPDAKRYRPTPQNPGRAKSGWTV